MNNQQLEKFEITMSELKKYNDKGAFEHSTIGELDLQEGLVAIEESAFAYSTLGFVVIPRSIVYVKSHAFAYNENMNGAMIPHNISNAEDILHGTMTDNRFVLSYHWEGLIAFFFIP